MATKDGSPYRFPKTVALGAILAGVSSLPFLTGMASAFTKPTLKNMNHPAVLELFTSQGCSSCPPADKVAAAYADSKDVLVLSFHVTYWNHLGWSDPYSKGAYDARQTNYAHKLHLDGLYTPQAVIQGTYDVVGSEASGVEAALEKGGKQTNWVSPTLSIQGGLTEISLPAGSPEDAEVLLVGYRKVVKNSVPRGENTGATLAHRNSVTEISSVGQYKGKAFTKKATTPQGDGVAVLLQDRKSGKIIGASWR